MMRAIVGALAAMLAAPAAACSCMFEEPPPGTFLHLNDAGVIALPANARGVLFQRHAQLDVSHRIHLVTFVKSLPAALEADAFRMHDNTANKAVQAIFAPLDVEAQMGKRRTYYLVRPGQIPEQEPYGYEDDLHQVARKYRLRNVSAEVKAAHGLFRIRPAGGFISGHDYTLMPRKRTGRGVESALIKTAPPLPGADPVSLTRVGPLVATRIATVDGAMCSSKRAAMVQRIAYRLPAQRQPYHSMLMAFTLQQAVTGSRVTPFYETSYRASDCTSSEIGVAEAGRGQELILGTCPASGEQPDGVRVRGFAGILELDDALQQTATIEVPFSAANKAQCRRLRLKGDPYD